MDLTNPSHHRSTTQTRVSRARRPLDRAYTLLSLLFLFALAAVVFVGVTQASPSTTQYGLGWYLSGGQAGTANQHLVNDSPMQSAVTPDAIGFERQLYALINKTRLDHGLPPLQLNFALTRAARGHSGDMAAALQFDTIDASGRSPQQRAEAAGYVPAGLVLEATGAGYASPEQLLNAAVDNTDTLEALLNPDVNEVGVGYASARGDKTFRHYWTIDLGRKSDLSFTVVVNNGAEATTSSQVTLYIGGKGWAEQMQVSNSPDFAGAVWEPFAETKTWQLSEGTGPKKIYIKLRSKDNQDVVLVGTVALDAAAKGIKPGPPYVDTMNAPRPAMVRVPAGEIALSGQPASGAVPVTVLTSNALSPSYYQTSEFMLGTVAVGLVTPQCNGAVDKCNETWTPGMLDQVAQQVNAGLDWWTRKLNKRVSFVVDQQRQIATGYEPINHSQSDESAWIADVMTHLGFTGSTYFEQVYAYNNWLRQHYGTDWAFTIFIANSQKSKSGTFSNGYFAYSYVPGPFTVATFDNDGYTINNMAAVIAHETGHIFGALDQYAGANIACTATSGYLVLQNQNSQQNCSSNVDSIMRGGLTPFVNQRIDNFALGMVGGRASRGDELPDPINTIPIVTLNPVQSPTANARPTIGGTVQDQPFPSPNGAAITINYITAVKYRVDGGEWQNASPADGSPSFRKVSQTFSFSPQLEPGAHKIEVQAFNRQNTASKIASTAITVQGVKQAVAPEGDKPTPVPPVATASPAATTLPPTPTPIPTPAPGSLKGMLVVPIEAGNTAVSVPGAGYKASSLINAINSQGGTVTEVSRWTGVDWQAYAPGGANGDFDIQVGVGYLVKAKTASTWTIASNQGGTPPPIQIDKGWSMLGIPPCKDGSLSCHTAASLVATINAQGGTVVEVDRWVDGGWSAYQVGYPFNDFPIYVGQSYFIRSIQASKWTP